MFALLSCRGLRGQACAQVLNSDLAQFEICDGRHAGLGQAGAVVLGLSGTRGKHGSGNQYKTFHHDQPFVVTWWLVQRVMPDTGFT
jgi:hypothetical protein